MNKPKIQRCGTPQGYWDHKKNGTEADDVCLKAYAKYMRDYRHRTHRNTKTLVSDDVLDRHGIKVAP